MVDYNIISLRTPVVRAMPTTATEAFKLGKPTIYHKEFDVSEIIGEKLASIRNIRTAHYFPVCFDNILRCMLSCEAFKYDNCRIGSYDFKEPGVEYRFATNLPYYYNRDAFEILLEQCSDDHNREEFVNENLEMFALDTYMGQIDRGANIYYEFHPNGEVHLSPIFDYSMSMLDEIDYSIFGYTSDFFQFLQESDYERMIVKYPQFEGMLRSYLGISLEDVIREVARERKFNLKTFDMDCYKRFDEGTHKRLEKILK